MATKDEKFVAEIVALARSVGLKGFADPQQSQQGSRVSAASDVIALGRKFGLKGFEASKAADHDPR
jgi:hypothetical protein